MSAYPFLVSVNPQNSSVVASAVALLLFLNPNVFAEAADSNHASHHVKETVSSPYSLAPLAALEQALEKNPPIPSTKKKKKSKRLQEMPGIGGQGAGLSGPGMVGASGGMMGKEMMDQMGKMMAQMGKPPSTMTSSNTSSQLPGFLGASHIYHMGATGFFLDHPDMISLTPEQQIILAQIKEAALLNQATSARKVEQAEQELWLLTSSEYPEIVRIEAKTKEIEILRTEKRLTFIRAVGESAKVLTPGQRSILLGIASTPARLASSNIQKNSEMAMPQAQQPETSMNKAGMADTAGKSGEMPPKKPDGGMESMESGDS